MRTISRVPPSSLRPGVGETVAVDGPRFSAVALIVCDPAVSEAEQEMDQFATAEDPLARATPTPTTVPSTRIRIFTFELDPPWLAVWMAPPDPRMTMQLLSTEMVCESPGIFPTLLKVRFVLAVETTPHRACPVTLAGPCGPA